MNVFVLQARASCMRIQHAAWKLKQLLWGLAANLSYYIFTEDFLPPIFWLYCLSCYGYE